MKEDSIHNRACFLSHLGEWMMKEDEFVSLSSLIISGMIKLPERNVAQDEIIGGPATNSLHGKTTGEDRTVFLEAIGILIVPITGMTMPKESKHGGTSTIRLRNIMKLAMIDPTVRAVMLKIDSPGGHVDGNHITADVFKQFASVKPLFAHTEATMASSAVWLGLPATRITATPMATIGSLGTISIVHDLSKNFEKAGVVAHVISTGKFKGMGMPGSKITSEHLTFIKQRTNELNSFFKKAVMESRNFTQEKVDSLFDGSFGLAQKALDDGLIDNIESFDEAIEFLRLHLDEKNQDGNKPVVVNPVAEPSTSATMETEIKQNESEQEIEEMSDIKTVNDLKEQHSTLCNEMIEAATIVAVEKASKETLEKEQTRIGDWMAFQDVSPKEVKEGISSGKCIGMPQATDLSVRRKDSDFKSAILDENPEDVVTPPEKTGTEGVEEEIEKAANDIVAAAENLN